MTTADSDGLDSDPTPPPEWAVVEYVGETWVVLRLRTLLPQVVWAGKLEDFYVLVAQRDYLTTIETCRHFTEMRPYWNVLVFDGKVLEFYASGIPRGVTLTGQRVCPPRGSMRRRTARRGRGHKMRLPAVLGMLPGDGEGDY